MTKTSISSKVVFKSFPSKLKVSPELWQKAIKDGVRNWVFTWNNYSEGSEALLKNLKSLRWGVYGHEIAPTTGTLHLQGAIVFKNQVTFSAIKKRLPGAVLFPMICSPATNERYCSKEAKDIVTLGDAEDSPVSKEEQGLKGKEMWTHIIKLAQSDRMDLIMQLYPGVYLSHRSNLKGIWEDYMSSKVPEKHTGPMPGVWIMGPAGTGKTELGREIAADKYGCPNPFVKGCKDYWWTRYKYQDTVILEDMDTSCTNHTHEFKVWIDRRKVSVRVHHGMMEINPRNFIVTSNYTMKQIFGHDKDLLESMTRRFPTVITLTKEDGDARVAMYAALEAAEDAEDPALLLSAEEIFGDEPM